MKKDYYAILGVSKDASEEDIKRSYRKLAHEFHPDKHHAKSKEDRATLEAKFKELNEAYQVLGSPDKRKQYDTFGSAGPNMGGGFNPEGFDFSGFQGFDPSQFGNFSVDMGDIFGDFFGFGGKGGGQKRGRDISIDIDLTLADTLRDAERRVLLRKATTCSSCAGSGAEKGSNTPTCETCSGSGTIRETKRTFLGTIAQLAECTRCHGRGTIPERQCKTCKGKGIETRSEEIPMRIPAGIRDGEVVRLTGQGEAIAHGTSGDLYVKVHVRSDKTYQRVQDHLHMVETIPLSLALTGGTRTVTTLDETITVTIPAGSLHKDVIRVHGKGFPIREHAGKRGDLLLELSITMPKKSNKAIANIADALMREGY